MTFSPDLPNRPYVRICNRDSKVRHVKFDNRLRNDCTVVLIAMPKITFNVFTATAGTLQGMKRINELFVEFPRGMKVPTKPC